MQTAVADTGDVHKLLDGGLSFVFGWIGRQLVC
jgi:hypothetical protein